MLVPLEKIHADPDYQVRSEMNESKIEEYAELFRDGAPFPPVTLGVLGGPGPEFYHLLDGFHRVEAARRAGLTEIAADVLNFDKSPLEMFETAFRANISHGIPLTAKDRRNALEKIIIYHSTETIQRIAEITGVSKSTIARIRTELSQTGKLNLGETVGKDGKSYPQKYQKPAIIKLCAGGCGTPILEDMKKAQDCTYIERDGKCYCSYDCYIKSRPVDWPDDDDEDDAAEPEIETEPEIISEPEPEPEPEIFTAPDSPGPLLQDFAHPAELDPAALAVPKCPFDPTHRPRLQRVSNNGYNVRCWDCDKEGRLVHTYTQRTWKKAYKDWGFYSDEVRPLEELLAESDRR